MIRYRAPRAPAPQGRPHAAHVARSFDARVQAARDSKTEILSVRRRVLRRWRGTCHEVEMTSNAAPLRSRTSMTSTFSWCRRNPS